MAEQDSVLTERNCWPPPKKCPRNAYDLKRVAAKLGFENDCCWVNNGGDAAEPLVEVGTMAHQYHQQKVCKERMGNWALKHVSRNNSTCMTHR